LTFVNRRAAPSEVYFVVENEAPSLPEEPLIPVLVHILGTTVAILEALGRRALPVHRSGRVMSHNSITYSEASIPSCTARAVDLPSVGKERVMFRWFVGARRGSGRPFFCQCIDFRAAIYPLFMAAYAHLFNCKIWIFNVVMQIRHMHLCGVRQCRTAVPHRAWRRDRKRRPRSRPSSYRRKVAVARKNRCV